MPGSPAHEIEVLSGDECVARLQAGELGRLAVVDPSGHPEIFPVNYFFDEGVVVFRSGPGTKLDLAPGRPVAFEVDAWDAESNSGWSVVVKGISHEITDPSDARARRIHAWPVWPAVAGAKDRWVGIWANEITGRALRSAHEEAGPQATTTVTS
jgi:uncharacterized protein